MKIMEVTSLSISDVKVVKYARFRDHRGYFTETFRKSDFMKDASLIASDIANCEFLQVNESVSKAGTFRGLHFQWNPFMGKFVRPITGRLIDFALDIRKNSSTYGKIIAYEIKANPEADFGEWIWIPVGFAHGILLPEDSIVEYMCSGEYSNGCEAGISPFAPEIDWSLCDKSLKARFDSIVPTSTLITDKDKNGLSLTAWEAHHAFEQFAC